jgi:Domain of unknown function (DUF4292)
MYLKSLSLVCLSLVVSLGASSCKRQKSKSKVVVAKQTGRNQDPIMGRDTLVQTPSEPIIIAAIPAFRKIAINQNDFNFLSTKSKVVIKTETGEQNVNISIRIKKDSLIWLSAGLMGIEGVRAMISADSIKMIDKINKKAYIFDFATLSKRFNFDLNFKLIQAILVGNMPLEQSRLDEILTEGLGQIIRQNREPISIDNYIETGRLQSIKVKEQKGNTLAIQYTDFQPVSALSFPFLSNTTISFMKDSKPVETKISIQHQKVEIPTEPLAFPFSIPATYERKSF